MNLQLMKDINERNDRLCDTATFENKVGLVKLIISFEYGIKKETLCEHLNVSEEFLNSALAYYKKKYGPYHTVDNYTIIFEPFGVIKSFR